MRQCTKLQNGDKDSHKSGLWIKGVEWMLQKCLTHVEHPDEYALLLLLFSSDGAGSVN